MSETPPSIEKANVLFVAVPQASNVFGMVPGPDGSEEIAIEALAICRYPDRPNEAVLMACDGAWNVVTEIAFDDVDQAKEQAAAYYGAPGMPWKEMPE